MEEKTNLTVDWYYEEFLKDLAEQEGEGGYDS